MKNHTLLVAAAVLGFAQAAEAQILAPAGRTRGVIVGVRQDPLEAYADLEPQFYPNGVPTSERGVALQTLRAARFKQAVPDAVVDPAIGPNIFRDAPRPYVNYVAGPPVFAPGFVPTLDGRLLSPLGRRSSLVTRPAYVGSVQP